MEKSRCILISLFALYLSVTLHGQESYSKEFLREIIRRHVRAVGHLDVQQKFSSFKAEGSLEEGDATAKFTIFKRDGRLRLEVLQGDTENVLLYDGKNAWQWTSHPSPKVLTKLNKEQTAWLEEEAQMDSLLARYDDLGFKAELVGLVTLPEYVGDLYQIRLRSAYLPDVYDIYLSSSNYLEMRRDYRPSANQEVLRTEFSDYREVDGLSLPFHVANYIGDNLVSVTELEHVQINAGVLGFYFQPPEDLLIQEQP